MSCGDCPCTVLVDGQLVPPSAPRWFAPGDHRIEVEADGNTERSMATVEAGRLVQVTAAQSPRSEPARPVALPPPKPAVSEETSDGGVSPAWFWIGVAATAVLGGVTIGSGIDTASKRAEFEDGPSDDTERAGRAAQERTNALLVATGGAALLTGVLGVFVVRWSEPGQNGSARLGWRLAGQGSGAPR